MPQLTINLSDDQHALLLKKAGGIDLESLTKTALDQYFARHNHSAEPLPPLDLSGRGARLRKLSTPEIDPNKPRPPERLEFDADEDYAKKMRTYEWQLSRYEAEKAHFEAKKRQGTMDQYGCVSCKL